MTELNFSAKEPNVYSELAHTLIHELTALGISSPPIDLIREAALDFTHPEIFTYVQELKNPSAKMDWHRIDWSEHAFSLGVDSSSVLVSPDLKAAISGALQDIENLSLTIDNVKVDEHNRIEMFSEGKSLVVIDRVKITSPNTDLAERVRKDFEKLRASDARSKIDRAFYSLPGMKAFKVQHDQIPDAIAARRRMKGHLLVLSPSNIAWCFREMLGSLSIDMKQSEALELTARSLGWQSWNHFSAAGQRHQPDQDLYAIQQMNDQGVEVEKPLFFTCLWTGMAAFCRKAEALNKECPLAPPTITPLSGMSLFMKAQALMPDGRQPDPLDGSTLLMFGKCDEAYGDNVDDDELFDIMTHEDGLEAGLRDYLAIELDPDTRSETQLEHRGYASQDRLQIKHWLFLKRHFGDNPHLFVEDTRLKGADRKVGNAACYKANLTKLESGWTLLSDYQRNEEVVFAGMTDEEAAQVMAFADLSEY